MSGRANCALSSARPSLAGWFGRSCSVLRPLGRQPISLGFLGCLLGEAQRAQLCGLRIDRSALLLNFLADKLVAALGMREMALGVSAERISAFG